MDELQAFPVPETDNNYFNPGMTLRDYFAAKAMQAAIAHYGFDGSHEQLAKGAYDTADAMLAEREK